MKKKVSEFLQFQLLRNLWLLFAILVPVWWFVSYQIAEQSFKKEFTETIAAAEQESDLLATDLADSISRNLHYIRGISDTLSQTNRIRRALETYKDTLPPGTSINKRRDQLINEASLINLSQFLEETSTHLNVNSIYLLNMHGESIATANRNKDTTSIAVNFAERDYFQSNKQGKRGFQFAVGKTTHIGGLYFSSPVIINNRFLGAVVTKIDVPKLSYLTRQIDSYVTDQYGVIILSYDKTREMTRRMDSVVMDLPEKARMDRYRQVDFPLTPSISWSDHIYPNLMRDQQHGYPVVVSSVKLPEYELHIYVEKKLPLYDNLLNEKNMLFYSASSAGTLIILLLLGMLSYLKASQQSKSLLKEHRDNLQQQVNAQTATLLEAKLAAESANRAKSSFLSTMSHEIRTPINAMLGMTHLALKTPLNDKQREYLEKSLLSGQHLMNVVNDILDFSKIEEGKLKLEKTNFMLDKSIRQAIDLNMEAAQCKKLKLQWHVDKAVPLAVHGDPLRVEQVLINLVSNAIKFTDKGTVTLNVRLQSIKASEFIVHFEVRDTGIGIEQSVLEALFQPFQQKDSSISRKYGGTGLGLSISKRLVEMMGGKIGATSMMGKGSIFWFELPLNTAITPAIESETPVKHAEISLQGVKLLLAEDNIFNQEVIAEVLEHEGVKVTVAADGNEALSLLEKGSYDLILMDMQMPGMDGLTATQQIRNQQKYDKLPIIALTANASLDDRELCLKAGMTDFLTKPVEPEDLFNMIRKHLVAA